MGKPTKNLDFLGITAAREKLRYLKVATFPPARITQGLTIWIPIANDTIVQLIERRKSDRPGPRFSAGDQVTFVGAGSQRGKHGTVVQVIEGYLDLVHRYLVQLNDGNLIRCFGFELEGFEKESSKAA